jgi:cell wall assembly regulator SMI1
MADALTNALDRLAQVLVREGDASERELAANTSRNPDFTWPEDAPALHASLHAWFQWRAVGEEKWASSLLLAFPLAGGMTWTQVLSPEDALERWRERPAHQPETLLEVLREVYVDLGDGSVWIYYGTAEETPERVRAADSLLQLVEATIQYYAARASSPWRELRLDSSPWPMETGSVPDDSQLAAMPAGTALLSLWKRIFKRSGRASEQALLGVCLEDGRWLVNDGPVVLDSIGSLVEYQLDGLRDSLYRGSPTCLSTAEFSKELQETRLSKNTRQPANFYRGRVRVWKQGELDSVLARLRAVLAARFPRVASSLREAASQQTLQQLETAMGFPLPADLRGLLSWADGQKPDSMPFRLNMRLLPATEIEDAVRMMRDLQRDGMLQPFWWDEGFLPFGANGSGDYLCLDLRGVYGPEGCVLGFFHKDRNRVIEARSLNQWLDAFVDGLEAGHWLVEDGQPSPRDWDEVKAFERLRTPRFPRELPCDAAELWLPSAE